MDCYSAGSRHGSEVEEAFLQFAGIDVGVKNFYSDQAPELIKIAKEFGWCHSTSVPYRSSTNARSERANRRVIEGVRTLLQQSGLPLNFWPLAARCFCLLRNTAKIRGRQSAWLKRFKKDFKGKRIPFGCLVPYIPRKKISKDMHRMDAPVKQGIFLGYKLDYGCKFNGCYYVADVDSFSGDGSTASIHIIETMDVKWEAHLHGVKFPVRETRDSATTPIRVAEELKLLRQFMTDDDLTRDSSLGPIGPDADAERLDDDSFSVPRRPSWDATADVVAPEEPPVPRRKRRHGTNVTVMRQGLYGGTPGCEGCLDNGGTGTHTKKCRDRFAEFAANEPGREDAEPVITRPHGVGGDPADPAVEDAGGAGVPVLAT